MNKFFLACLLVCGYAQSALCKDEDFIVVIPSYHNKNLVEANLNSITSQVVPHRIIYIADGDLLPDSDGTGQQVLKYMQEKNLQDRLTLIRNKDRKLALNNIYRAVLNTPDEWTIVLVDGDDELVPDVALAHINSAYKSATNNQVWLTYGNFKLESNGLPWAWTTPIPEYVIAQNAFREWGNGPTHVKTFKPWLLKQIKIEDLFFEGNFFKSTYDVALFEPMMEMAGKNHKCIQEVLYIYNDENPLNDHKVDRELQIALDHLIRRKQKYIPLTESKSGWVDKLKQENKLTVDLVVLATSKQATESFLDNQITGRTGINSINVFFDSTVLKKAILAKKFNQVNWIDTSNLVSLEQAFKDIFASTASRYITFVTDSTALPEHLTSFTDPLYWLEQTHAYSHSLLVNKHNFSGLQAQDTTGTVQPVSLSLEEDNPTSLYAWHIRTSLNKTPWVTELALYRKKDIDNISALVTGLHESPTAFYFCLSAQAPLEKVNIFYNG